MRHNKLDTMIIFIFINIMGHNKLNITIIFIFEMRQNKRNIKLI